MNKTIVLVSALCVVAVYAMGLRMDIAKKEAKHNKEKAQMLTEQMVARTELVKNISKQASEHYNNLETAKNEIDRMASALAANTGKLRIRAECPKLPATTKTGVVDNAESARLTRAAEQNYLLLRERIETINAQLLACQSWVRAVTND